MTHYKMSIQLMLLKVNERNLAELLRLHQHVERHEQNRNAIQDRSSQVITPRANSALMGNSNHVEK